MATDAGTQKPTPKRLLVTGAAVLALGVLAGVGSWRVGVPGRNHGATTAVRQATMGEEPRRTQTTSVPLINPAAQSAAALAPAPLVVYLVPSEEQRTLVEAYLHRTGLHGIAYTVSSPDEADRWRLPGLEFATGEQWNRAEAAILQQRVEADQLAITRAMTGQ